MPLFLCNTEQQKQPVHKPDVSDLSQKTLTALAGVLAPCSDENQQDVIRSCSRALTWKLLLRHSALAVDLHRQYGSFITFTQMCFFLDLW